MAGEKLYRLVMDLIGVGVAVMVGVLIGRDVGLGRILLISLAVALALGLLGRLARLVVRSRPGAFSRALAPRRRGGRRSRCDPP